MDPKRVAHFIGRVKGWMIKLDIHAATFGIKVLLLLLRNQL